MKAQNTSLLYDQKQSAEFYEDRYEQGYLEEWPIEKKRKIFEVIQDIQLPAKGEALDFGCGNGVLTEIIRQGLPSWKIFGTDISNKAVSNARLSYPKCTFFEANSPDFTQKKFDFIFTNHVFEHVFNLTEVFNQMNEYLKPKSSMLHFLPCGNEGSYEYNICLLRKDGINTELAKRFFFEDEGHVRRLTTDEFCKLKKKPLLIINILDEFKEIRVNLNRWLETNNITILNIAGPRESEGQIYKKAKDLLIRLLKDHGL